ncbi:hypothetical protein OSTOST_19518, partial [Ostertagia ostertagi]
HSAKEFRRQYTVLEEIGRGGFGIVYRAVRIADGLPVAVKFREHKATSREEPYRQPIDTLGEYVIWKRAAMSRV